MHSKIESLFKLIEAYKFGAVVLMTFIVVVLAIVGLTVEHSIAVVMRHKYNKELLKKK